MALLLHIDTSTDVASICLSEDSRVVSYAENTDQRDHAGWLQPAILQMMKSCSIPLQHLHAAGVTSGPGSYTGLRVGLATTKGLCFALQIPLITVNTLEAMASAAPREEGACLCPMIDARRMEVFTAVYDADLHELQPPCAMQVEADSFDSYLQKGKVIFFGNGAEKVQQRIRHVNANFCKISFNASFLPILINKKYHVKAFSDLTYTEPSYFKEFYTPAFRKTV